MLAHVINLRLMSHPANWAIVTLTVMIAALALDYLTRETAENV